MVSYRRNRGDEIFSTINITPFTDIIMVLLIVFMIAAPGLASSVMNVQLPGSSTSTTRASGSLSVALDIKGNVYIDSKPISRDELVRSIKEGIARNPDTPIILNADGSVQHAKVIELLDVIREAGGRGIYVGTTRER